MSTPAVEIRSFAATIPAGTAKGSPVTLSVAFPARVVTEVHWRVPPGPSGLMGWKLTMSNGQAVLPTNGTFIVVNDKGDTWPVVNQPDGGQWEVTGYNTDIYDHTVYLDFFLDLVGQSPAVTTFLPNAALSSPPPVATPVFVTTPAAVITPAVITAALAVSGG